jgi:DHA2 family multidrug resistance protein
LRLTEHLVPSSPLYQGTLRQAAAHFAAAGATRPDVQHRAIEWLGQLVQTQTSLMSYIDVFWGFAIVAALLIPVALFLLQSIKHRAASADH